MVALATPGQLSKPLRELLADIEERRAGHGVTRPDPHRLRIVESMWIDMQPTAVILTEVSRAFGCSTSTITNDLRSVIKHHTLSDEIDRPTRAAQMRAQWIDLRNEAKQNGDRRTAALVNDRLCKMDGLYAPERSEHVNVNITLNVTIDNVLEKISDSKVLEALSLVLEAIEKSRPIPIEAIDATSVEVPLTIAEETT